MTSHRPPTFTGEIEFTLAHPVPPLLFIRDPLFLRKTCVTLNVLMGDPAGMITGTNSVEKSKSGSKSNPCPKPTAAMARGPGVNRDERIAPTLGGGGGGGRKAVAGLRDTCNVNSGLIAKALALLATD